MLYEKLDNSDYGNGEIALDMARSATEFRRPTSEFVEGVKLNPGEGFPEGRGALFGWLADRCGRQTGGLHRVDGRARGAWRKHPDCRRGHRCREWQTVVSAGFRA